MSPLIQRISSAAKTRFNETSPQVDLKITPSAPPSPQLLKQEDDLEENNQDIDVDDERQIEEKPKVEKEDWEKLFQSDEERPETEEIPPRSRPKKEEIPARSIPAPPKPQEEDPVLDEDLLLDSEKDKTPLAPKQDLPKELNENDPHYRREIRRRRRWKGAPRIPLSQFLNQSPASLQTPLVELSPTPDLKPAVKPLEKPVVPQTKNEPMIIECGGGGDCQLHSILKGLEMQHPERAKVEKNKKMVLYTSFDLRQMGVTFAREKYEEARLYTEKNSGKLDMDKISVHAQRILGYLDADRREHNEDEVNAVQYAWEEEKAKLEKALNEKKIKPADYEKQKKAIYLKYDKKTDHLEKNVVVKSDEEFLNRLGKNGFSCSTVHLYALSAQLNVPILVHEKDGIPGHDIQTFNASESELVPIHLLRVSRGHFKLLLFPDQSA